MTPLCKNCQFYGLGGWCSQPLVDDVNVDLLVKAIGKVSTYPAVAHCGTEKRLWQPRDPLGVALKFIGALMAMTAIAWLVKENF